MWPLATCGKHKLLLNDDAYHRRVELELSLCWVSINEGMGAWNWIPWWLKKGEIQNPTTLPFFVKLACLLGYYIAKVKYCSKWKFDTTLLIKKPSLIHDSASEIFFWHTVFKLWLFSLSPTSLVAQIFAKKSKLTTNSCKTELAWCFYWGLGNFSVFWDFFDLSIFNT